MISSYFHIIASVFLSAPFPGFISDLHGPQAEREIIHGELYVKGKSQIDSFYYSDHYHLPLVIRLKIIHHFILSLAFLIS